MSMCRTFIIIAVTLFGILICSFASAATVEYELTIAYQNVNYTGKAIEAMTVNGGIPGPTLHFTEGDLARITVHNQMDVESSIHWHGLLVPPGMDGVPLISFPPIAPGTSFVYEFPIRQNGTYWYHSHTSLQEQKGVYGSIVIDSLQQELLVDRDHVVLLSDWTDEDPHRVLRTLKRGSEWYALEKGSAQSIFGAARNGKLGAYFSRELQRMPAMDIADVAYDRFLANGVPETNLAAEPGEVVRLRIIDGSATTFFHLEFAGGPLRIVSADGQNVEPLDEQRLLIGVAETYDVLVTVPDSGAWELRATAHDGSGYASVWLGVGERYPAPAVPLPDLYSGMGHGGQRIFALTPAGSMGMSDAVVASGRFDQPGMMGMDHSAHDMKMGTDSEISQMDHSQHDMAKQSEAEMVHAGHDMEKSADSGITHEDEDLEGLFEDAEPEMDHSDHAMTGMQEDQMTMKNVDRSGKRYGRIFRPMATDISAVDNLAIDGMDSARPWPPYEKLRATRPTALPVDAPVREVRLTLDGDMERYVWSLNNLTLAESDDILIREGEVVRFIMINRTMMHHPMHLHGHFFRVVNGQGDYAPLKHTVNVAPMSTTVIEFEANEVGDWFFHCHLLYHMKSGMARAVHYENFNLTPQLTQIRPQLYKDSWYAWGEVDLLSNMFEGTAVLSSTRNILMAEVEVGWQEVDETEWEAFLLWERSINRFFSLFAGGNFEGELIDGEWEDAVEEERGLIGVHYLLPLNLESSVFVATDGEARFSIEKEFELTPRIGFCGEVEYDTEEKWESAIGVSYLVNKTVSAKVQWHSEYQWGAGLQIRF